SNDGNAQHANVQTDGFLLRSNTEQNRILQVRIGGLFTFHKTMEYENFDVLVNELDCYWEKFQDAYGNLLTITNVSLRYLNFVEVKENENSEEYVRVKASSPFGGITNTLTQIQFTPIKDNK